MRGLFHNIQAFNSPGESFDVRVAFKTLIAAPRLNFDNFVVSIGVGIALYFGLGFEPDWRVVVAVLAVISALVYWGRDKDTTFWAWMFIIFAIALGFGRAVWHSHAVKTPRLPFYEHAYDVRGWVESIQASGSGVSWHLRVKDIEQLEPNQTPHKVRIRLGQKHLEAATASDFIEIRAILSEPPGPAVYNGYNPSRRAYYDKIGGFGFAISVPKVERSDETSLKQKISKLRFGLAKRISETGPSETAGLQAALLTGVRRYIPPDQTDALRAAGLAHILAISGLHMGLLAGSAYYVFTFLLACIAPLSRRYDVRKFAAILAIVAAASYLVLSGASVATQRAFIMAVIIFTAVILDRQAISIRSVSVAAFITLILHPESLVSVGFQMSFAAVLALVVVYRHWQDRRHYPFESKWAAIIRRNFISLSVTSFVAGLATAGFALFHFGRIARYGLLGNLFAMPIFTFAVMPLGIISLIAFPFSLERFPLWLMGQSLLPILEISKWVASLEGAMTYIRQAPNWMIAVYGLAFIWMLVGKLRARILAMCLIVICALGWWTVIPPDIRISEDGRVSFWETEEYQRLIVTSERADRYGREQFAEKAGQSDFDVANMHAVEAPCDELACRFVVQNKVLSILNHPSEARLECEQSDIVILTQRDVGPEVRRHCRAELIDGRVLREGGAQEIYLSKGTVKRVGIKKPTSQRRLWE
ncbi:competence protein ComEC [Litorimonas taeanensis]|uniref:Competence protein ComEC n=1 Tax=Litorimonas taeanensis TaxID=568099 RepID=A0A420WKX0_9PROT|nr:competence protein ComEC [Litorimonas taeanensis]